MSPILPLLILLDFELQKLELLPDLLLAQHSFPEFLEVVVSLLHAFLQLFIEIFAQFVQFVSLLEQSLVVRFVLLCLLAFLAVRQLSELFLQKLYIFLVFACFFLLETQQLAQALLFLRIQGALSGHLGVQTGLAWVLSFLRLFHLSAHRQFSFDGGFGIQGFIKLEDL